ncbi:MAG: uracil-DNA glycosylase [Phycisphaerales bacterium]
MSRRSETLGRALAQHARTSALLGVDFLPVSSRAVGEVEVKSPAPAGERETMAGKDAPMDKRAALEELKRRHDAECAHCTSAPPFTQTVFGDGDPDAELMFIGEAPGAEEDRTGVPFVGRAGEKLNDMIRAMGLEREDVYIANILKARPPNNATPTPDEAQRCGVWLKEQIRIVRPKVIVTLGKPAANYMLENRDSMGSMRGTWWEYADGDMRIPLMPTFHPAYLLRAYTPENRKKVWSDLQAAMQKISG